MLVTLNVDTGNNPTISALLKEMKNKDLTKLE
jgi:hypothetical protein